VAIHLHVRKLLGRWGNLYNLGLQIKLHMPCRNPFTYLGMFQNNGACDLTPWHLTLHASEAKERLFV
jgi:hypothetical protein